MGKNQSASNLTNIIKQDASGNISFVSGSTTLMSVSSSGAVTTTGNVAGTASYASNAELFDGLNSTVFATTGSNTFTRAQYISNTSTPTNFTDTASLYTDGGMQVKKDVYLSSSLFVKGDLTIFGTQSVNYITSSQLNIADNIITVNTSTPAVRFGGIAVQDSGSLATGLTGSLLWDSQNNHWVYTNPSGSSYSGGMLISGPRASSLGEEQGTTFNALMKGQGGDHITSSGIFESGSNVGIGTASPNEKLQVEGAISATGTASTAFANSSTLDWYSTGTRIISRGANTSTRGTFILKLESSNSSLSSDVLQFSNLGAATFSSSVSLGGYLTGQGVNPGGLGGSRYVIDWLSGYMRIFSYGADTSTNGGFVLNSQRSNGTNDKEYLSISATGLATFSSNGGNLAIFKTNNATDSYNSAVILAGNADATQANRNAYILLDPNGANGTGTDYAFFTALGTGETQFGTSKSDGFLALYTADTAKMRITSAGNVGIGTSFVISSYFGSGQTGGVLQVATNVAKTATANTFPIAFLSSNDATYPLGLYLGMITGATTGARKLKLQGTEIGVSPNDIVMQTDGARVGIGTSSPSYKLHTSYDGCGDYVAQFHNINSGDCGGSGVLILQGGTFNSGDTTSRYISFRRGDGTEIGAVRRSGASNVAFDTSSDYRLKEDLKDFNGLDKISAIKVYDFKWKNTTERMNGVLSHELKEVIPYAVGGEKDGIDGKGDMIIQGVDYSKLVPVLIKSIQELNTKLDAANAEIEALKNK